jgi:hypothetical protein
MAQKSRTLDMQHDMPNDTNDTHLPIIIPIGAGFLHAFTNHSRQEKEGEDGEEGSV